MTSNKKVALVLSGCGVYDGSEITESITALVHLSRAGCDVSFFAPDKDQMHVIDHTKGAPMEGVTRNCMIEASRIARGSIAPLSTLKAADFDSMVVPGGFGAAKNLSNFAVMEGPDSMTVDPDMEQAVKDFAAKGKVMGFSCISPVVVAKVLGKDKVKITMGLDDESNTDFPYAGACQASKTMGAAYENTGPPCATAVVDESLKVVTCAAYMYNTAKPHEVDDSVKAMIDEVVKLMDGGK